jgi:hypothetical protein
MSDNKVWNEKMGYMMNPEVNKKLDEEVREYQKGNKLADEMDEEDEEDDRYAIFDSAVFDAVTKAQDLYCEDGASLRTTIEALIDWLEECKDKGPELKKKLEEIEDDDDEEDEEEESTK